MSGALAGVVRAVAVLAGVAALARIIAIRRPAPCPASLSWILENPYTAAVAGSGRLLDRAEVGRGMRVLDAGCGPGRVAIPAAKRVGSNGQVVALDLQSAMLERVERRARARGLSNVTTRLGSLGSVSLEPAGFDRVLLVTVLGEIPDRARALRALHAALAPGGILSVTELLLDPHYQPRRVVERLAREAGFDLECAYGGVLAYTLNFRKRGDR